MSITRPYKTSTNNALDVAAGLAAATLPHDFNDQPLTNVGLTADSVVWYDGTQLTEDTDFTYDSTTKQLSIGSGSEILLDALNELANIGTIVLNGTSNTATIGNWSLTGTGPVVSYGNAAQIHGTNKVLDLSSDWALRWSNTAGDASQTKDTGLARSAAGVVKATDGSTGLGGLTAATLSIQDAASVDATSPWVFALPGGGQTVTQSAERISLNIDLDAQKNFPTGALAAQREIYISRPEYTFVASSTVTKAATVYIDGAPLDGTNCTLTDSWGLYVDSLPSGTNQRSARFVGDWDVIDHTTETALSYDESEQTLGIGAAAPSWSLTNSSRCLVSFPTKVVPVDSNGQVIRLEPKLTEAASGTHGIMAGMVISSLVVTGAAASSTIAAGLVVSVPQPAVATDNYAVWATGVIRVDSAVALGGGSTATLGTVGGSGPATAAQNEWIQIDTQNGTRWVPAWS